MIDPYDPEQHEPDCCWIVHRWNVGYKYPTDPAPDCTCGHYDRAVPLLLRQLRILADSLPNTPRGP